MRSSEVLLDPVLMAYGNDDAIYRQISGKSSRAYQAELLPAEAMRHSRSRNHFVRVQGRAPESGQRLPSRIAVIEKECRRKVGRESKGQKERTERRMPVGETGDRKSTRLNSSHLGISYAVFCLK